MMHGQIAVIKAMREACAIGLYEAKQITDSYIADNDVYVDATGRKLFSDDQCDACIDKARDFMASQAKMTLWTIIIDGKPESVEVYGQINLQSSGVLVITDAGNRIKRMIRTWDDVFKTNA